MKVNKGDVLRSKHDNIVVVASHTGNGFYRAIDLADGYVYERLADQEGNLEEHWNHLEWKKLFNIYESVSATRGPDV